MFRHNKKLQKITLAIFTVIFIFSNFFFLFGWNVKSSSAQMLVFDPTNFSKDVGWRIIDDVWKEIKAIFFKNVLGTLANQVASQSAIWIASGGKGTKPQFITDFKGFTQGIADAAIGDLIQTVMKDLTGLDVCTLDPRIAINLALSIPTFPGFESRYEPNCTWTQLKNHWEEIGSSELLTFSASIGPGGEFNQNIAKQTAGIVNNDTLQIFDTATTAYSSCTSFTTAPGSVGTSKKCLTAPAIQKNLEEFASKLNALIGSGLEQGDLGRDVEIMQNNALSGETVSLSIGSYEIVPENIPIIKQRWLEKINQIMNPAGDNLKQLDYILKYYQGCAGKAAADFAFNPCDNVASTLLYKSAPKSSTEGQDQGVNIMAIYNNEINGKISYILTTANSIKSGFEYLKSQVEQKFSPEYFEGSAAYNANLAKDFFSPEANEFNAYQTLQKKINETGLSNFMNQQVNLLVGQGWNSATDTISGLIRTPSDLLRAKAGVDLTHSTTASQYTENIAADALGVFLQTLWNQYMQRLLQGLANPIEGEYSKKFNFEQQNTADKYSPYSQSIVTPQGVAKYIETISKQFKSGYSFKDINLLSDFQLQLQGLVNPNIYNNVIDSNFALAINEKQTIKEALEAGRLLSGHRFSWGAQQEPGTYHLANLKKLRKARVVPLGMELAVELIKDCNDFQKCVGDCGANSACLSGCNSIKCVPGQNIPVDVSPANIASASLGDVVAGFDQPGEDGLCGTLDSQESPFCNLINPNWVLKIPPTKCSMEAEVEPFGEILQTNDSSQRYSRCTDFVSCIEEDGKGGCVDEQYGFCVKEKNTWRLNAEKCPSDYNSCRSYIIKEGEQTSTVSYLQNTLAGDDVCNADNAGCTGYSYDYSQVAKIWNDQKTIYLSNNIENCEAENDGCTMFTPKSGSDLAAAIGEGTNLYYRKPPAYLGCTGTSADLPECKNYLTVCDATEVGCQLFTPVNGDPVIPAVALPSDYCVAECVGYNTYVQQKTYYEPNPQNNGFANFIAQTATACSAEEVDCSQFTNLDEVAKGGEGTNYYTFLKQCIKPNLGLGEKTFFTWENSATSGPKIIRYWLQQDRTGNCSDSAYSDETACENAGKIWSVGGPKTLDGSSSCVRTCAPEDINCQPDPNCLEFFDEAGNRYIRNATLTISVSEDCHPMRKTDSDPTNCLATNGRWQDTNNDNIGDACIYDAIPNEGLTCRSDAVGCRAYTGNRGNNVYNVLYDTFETKTTSGWLAGNATIENSTEAITLGGHSLVVIANSGSSSISKEVPLQVNGLYTLTFWAKTDNKDGERVRVSLDKVDQVQEYDLKAKWQSYTFGPFKASAVVDLQNNKLFFSNIRSIAYFDNILVKRISDRLFIIKNSWQTPAVCDTPTIGSMLNCQAYTNANNQTLYFKSFANLCGEDKVGCQLVIDTKNYSAPLPPKDRVPADDSLIPEEIQNQLVHTEATYVLNEKYKCEPVNKGCQKMGQPILAGTVTNYVDAYIKNDPDKYENVAKSILCDASAIGCVELINETGTSEYYKINKDRICQFDLDSGKWYKKGTSSGCYSELNNVLKNYNIYKTTDTEYLGYIGECDNKYAGCTKFTAYSQQAAGQLEELLAENSYHVIDAGANLDRTGCNSVNWNEGCVKFDNDVSGSQEVLKVDRDRDCDEFVMCKEKDAAGLCVKAGICSEMEKGECINWLLPCEYDATGKQCAADAEIPECVINEDNICVDKKDGNLPDNCEKNGLGECISIYEKLRDNVRYNYAGVAIPIERIAVAQTTPSPAGVGFGQGYIYRMNSGSSLINDLDTWEAGDYSGYSISQRHPLETELEYGSGDGFKLYPEVSDTGPGPDRRYIEPICKYFPASDSPLPYEMSKVSGTKLSGNIYSPSYQADLESLGNMCSYAEIKSLGVTTYFPLVMHKIVDGVDEYPQVNEVTEVCTSPEFRQGKWCNGNDECLSSSYQANGTCSAVEDYKIYNGIEGMCLEYDTLSPVYADIYKTFYDGEYVCSNIPDVNIFEKILSGYKERRDYCQINRDAYTPDYSCAYYDERGIKHVLKAVTEGDCPVGAPGTWNSIANTCSIAPGLLTTEAACVNEKFWLSQYNYQPYACLTYFPLSFDVCPYHKTKNSCMNNPSCSWGFCWSGTAAEKVFETNYPSQEICTQEGKFWQEGPCVRKQ